MDIERFEDMGKKILDVYKIYSHGNARGRGEVQWVNM